MEKRSYNAASIERILKTFERGYSIPSLMFFEEHESDGPAVQAIPGVHRQAWAGFYRTWLRLSDSGFAAQVARELELV
jgi:hypothetical protein